MYGFSNSHLVGRISFKKCGDWRGEDTVWMCGHVKDLPLGVGVSQWRCVYVFKEFRVPGIRSKIFVDNML